VSSSSVVVGRSRDQNLRSILARSSADDSRTRRSYMSDALVNSVGFSCLLGHGSSPRRLCFILFCFFHHSHSRHIHRRYHCHCHKMLTPVVLAELQQQCARCEDCKTGIECSITSTQSVMALVEIDSDETDGTGVDTVKGDMQ